MWKMMHITLILLPFLLLAGCDTNTNKEGELYFDEVKAWFTEQEPEYVIHSIQSAGDDTFALLTTFTPPGVEEGYTMIRAYIVSEDGGRFTVKALKDTYGARIAGFSAELLGTENVTVLFGDIGDSIYDIKTDTVKDVDFETVIVECSDGVAVSNPIKNNTPYLVVLKNGYVDVEDIIYKGADWEVQYYDCFNEFLDATPDNIVNENSHEGLSNEKHSQMHEMDNQDNLAEWQRVEDIDENSIEYQIWTIIESNDLSEEDTNFVVENLQNIDWVKYNRIGQSATELLDWFYGLEFTNLQRLDVLYNIHMLDGAMAETYASVVGEIFIEDMKGAIEFLCGKGMTEQTAEMLDFIAHYCVYFDADSILEELYTLGLDQIENGEVIRDSLANAIEVKKML